MRDKINVIVYGDCDNAVVCNRLGYYLDVREAQEIADELNRREVKNLRIDITERTKIEHDENGDEVFYEEDELDLFIENLRGWDPVCDGFYGVVTIPNHLDKGE